MPRKTEVTQNFNAALSLDASNQDIVNALKDNLGELEETTHTLRNTHLGHELHLWDAEVDEVE